MKRSGDRPIGRSPLSIVVQASCLLAMMLRGRVPRRAMCEEISLPALSVAVGTGVAPSPPHRSRRAELPHRAPASGSNVATTTRIGMHDPGIGQPEREQLVYKRPVTTAFLAAPCKNALPEERDVVSKRLHGIVVARHAVITVMTNNNRLAAIYRPQRPVDAFVS